MSKSSFLNTIAAGVISGVIVAVIVERMHPHNDQKMKGSFYA